MWVSFGTRLRTLAGATTAAAGGGGSGGGGGAGGAGGGGGGGNSTLFVDLGVYTRSRCFRLVASSKLGSTACLRVNDAACAALPPALSPPSPALSERSLSD